MALHFLTLTMQSDVTSDGQRLLIVLCGLPGAGKSSFARALQTSTVGNFPPPNSTLHHVCFDELYADTSNAAASFDRNAWHESRRVAFDKTTELLQLPIATSSHQIIVVDDNMHLRSMRKPFMQLARKYHSGYIIAYFDVSLDTAMELNCGRPSSAQVTTESMQRIAGTLQPPPILDHSSSATSFNDEESEVMLDPYRHSLVVRLRHAPPFEQLVDFDFDVEKLCRAFTDAIALPLKQVDEAEVARQREQLRHNTVAQADLFLRRCVGDIMSALASGTSQHPIVADIIDQLRNRPRQKAALLVNTCRQRVLDSLRSHTDSIDATQSTLQRVFLDMILQEIRSSA